MSTAAGNFFELSRYINEMLQSLLANDRKMSYVLGKTDNAHLVYMSTTGK